MYGTIFKLKIKEGHEDQLLSLMKEENETPEGMIAWFLMKPDENKEWIGVAIFDSVESHVNNANRPETNENFMKMMEHLDGEPEWTDGEYLIGELAYGSAQSLINPQFLHIILQCIFKVSKEHNSQYSIIFLISSITS